MLPRRIRLPLLCASLAAACSGGDPAAEHDLSSPAPDLIADQVLPPPDRAPDTVAPPLPLTISGVKVTPNPNNRLSCFVSFRTNRAALPGVEFWASGPRASRVWGRAPGTDHKVLVIGMLAKTRYYLAPTARDSKGVVATAKIPAQFVTGKLPLHVPVAKVVIHDPRRVHAGWTLATLAAGSRASGAVTMDPDFVPTAVMYDMEGRPVWYHEHALPRVGDARYVDGHVLVASMGQIHEPKLSALEIDLAGRPVWLGPMQPLDTVHGHYNHHFEKLENGHYMAIKNQLVRRVIGDVIVMMKPNHKEIWTWRSMDHLKPDLTSYKGPGFHDYMHGNSLQADLDRGAVYYNARHQSAVFKISRQTGKILWRLGQGGTFKADPKVPHPWFQQAHAVEVQPNGNVLLYDNGLGARGFSRAVEYRLDEVNKTATIAWQYSGYPERPWQTLYWGDADRLPNGNTLITAGTWAKKQNSLIFEVTPDHQLVWEIKLPIVAKSGLTIGAYNAQRLTPPVTTFTRSAGAADGGAQ